MYCITSTGTADFPVLTNMKYQHFYFQNDRLVEAFGSTKRKKAMKSRLQNKIDSEDLGHSVSGAVNHMISQPKRNGEEGTLYLF